MQKFEKNAAFAQGTTIPDFTSLGFVQYAADNVDHNIRTLDGSGAFHGMGIIATVTPGTRTTQSIPKRNVTGKEICTLGRIQIRFHREERHGLSAVEYQTLVSMKPSDPTGQLDIL